jgi:glycosyltransferase involved in cell wall biosynthesis
VKILIVHRPYARQAGGEERVVETQTAVLRARGHEVVVSDGRDAAPVIAQTRPDIGHVHTQFQPSAPTVYGAAFRARVPVVQHLHNARITCVQPFLVRDGVACTDCVGHAPLSGVIHRCYRGSFALSAAATAVQLRDRAVWRRRVERFVAVSDALAETVRASGVIPAARVTVCHNGVDFELAPGGARRDGALYVGRLSYEKGVDLLIDAARDVDMQVVIAGDGPERAALERQAGPNVAFVGHLDRPQLADALARAAVLVAPSRGQEPFGLGVIEAAAAGVPSVVTRVGGMPEIVRDGETGVVVEPFSAEAIVAALRSDHDWHALGAAARRGYDARFTADAFADRLLAIYDDVLGSYAP